MKLDAQFGWDGVELELSASEKALFSLASSLRQHAYGSYELKKRRDRLSILQLTPDPGLLNLSIVGSAVVLKGNQKSFELFADNLDFLRRQWSEGGKQHLHVDYDSNRILVSSESEALIVSKA